ncbi:MAG: hypothetical protein M1816_001110 [Peltula sp. TS41687]|nr:MAG: hypothetical protein M1816_001110 [Peltula sp. TS41687]
MSTLYLPSHHGPSLGPIANGDQAQGGPSTKLIVQTSLNPPTRTSSPTLTPLRRKPLPVTASPLALKPLSVDHWEAGLEQNGAGYRSGPHHDFTAVKPLNRGPEVFRRAVERFSEVDLSDDFKPGEPNRAASHVAVGTAGTTRLRRTSSPPPLDHPDRNYDPSHDHVRRISESSLDDPAGILTAKGLSIEDEDHLSGGHQASSTMPLFSSGKPRNLMVHLDGHSRDASSFSYDSVDSTVISKPRSPFAWKNSSPGAPSSATSFSDQPSSPLSPKLLPQPSYQSPRMIPPAIDVTKANTASDMGMTAERGFDVLRTDMDGVGRLDDMEEELREISSELAASIRREMDLEDLVDKLQEEAGQQVPVPNKRTSDYFSDSGTSSAKPSLADFEAKELEVEKLQRKAEQEKAQLRLRLTQRVQYERLQRKAVENQVRRLEERAQQLDLSRTVPANDSGRIKQLEAALEETRRRLSEERRMKENYEDLLSALRADIEAHRNERDNLRDEVVPGLKARVDGLETEAAEHQRLMYDHTRMQQELQAVKNENITLINSKILQQQSQQGAFQTVAEDSNQAHVSSMEHTKQMPRTQPNSVREVEVGDCLADRVKDIEAQRDALHRALRSLLDRQEHQTREHKKKVKALEMERDRALEGSPRKGYNREVSHMRDEINHLRRRADEALEQKWQCEKGLSGLKKDLDRAEQETSSLRTLLQEHDILVPEENERSLTSSEHLKSDQTTSASLQKAYRELQTTHGLALVRIQELEGHDHGSSLKNASVEAERTMELLKKSISDAEAERDYAQRQAEEYRVQVDTLREAGQGQTEEEESLAGQLRASATRVEELAVQIRQQLESNHVLRQRLAEAIARGDREQKASAARITEMQGKLKSLEDLLTAAQQHSEDTIARHEEEVRQIRESHNYQLQRMKNHFKRGSSRISPTGTGTGAMPMSPLFSARSPRLDKTTSGMGMSMIELSKSDFLERRVEDLERALSDADREMGEVVSRMNLAQIEVMELQSERDEAIRQTRRLQASILQERENVKALIV